MTKLARVLSALQTKDIPYEQYATKEFEKVVEDIRSNNMMNTDVDKALKDKVSAKALEKAITSARKKHAKWAEKGSALHHGVVAAMWRLLTALYETARK